MPIGFGIGVSHAPGMYVNTEEQWNEVWNRHSGVLRGVPQHPATADETGERLQNIFERIQAGHAELKRQFDAYDPDVLIMIGGDQTETFDNSNVPQFMVYLGKGGPARTPSTYRPGNTPGGPGSNMPPVELKVDVDFSQWLLTKLVKQEKFDITFSYEDKSLGRGAGLPHAYGYPSTWLLKDLDVPTVIIYENTYNAPSLSAKRCYDFGAALARITKNDPRRIAILGSGGLSHDPGGKRSSWIDPSLDRWFLDQLAQGNGRATQAMYTFASDAMAGGTGENRAWITVAGAMEEMGSRAKVLDYVEARKTVTGLGFAYWHADPKYTAVAAE
jgi:3-O-methylgallate 3,4-dioxygenase